MHSLPNFPAKATNRLDPLLAAHFSHQEGSIALLGEVCPVLASIYMRGLK